MSDSPRRTRSAGAAIHFLTAARGSSHKAPADQPSAKPADKLAGKTRARSEDAKDGHGADGVSAKKRGAGCADRATAIDRRSPQKAVVGGGQAGTAAAAAGGKGAARGGSKANMLYMMRKAAEDMCQGKSTESIFVDGCEFTLKKVYVLSVCDCACANSAHACANMK